jgi:hypothetical protein
MKRIASLLLFYLFPFLISSQTLPFSIHLEPLLMNDISGLQAYAFGQYDGKWLVLGGRLDGLHKRQPFAAFNVEGNNNQIFVIDPILKKKWQASINTLPTTIQEQLSSTNMEFYQDGKFLYIIGGYGFNRSSSAKVTFDYITAIDVPAVINAVISKKITKNHFRQLRDPSFAVSGGQLKKINGSFYLIGGNKFDGNYNPMGHRTYTQAYTNSIRKFAIYDNGIDFSINHLKTFTDTENLHRRDFNAVPQIFPNRAEGITAFSGVFKTTSNLPFLNAVDIDSVGYSVNQHFVQLYNHYHCAVLPIYSQKQNRMYTLFFGGIAQYYDSLGVTIKDDNIPFVKTIAMIVRDENGKLSEYKMPIEMPGYIGASAEFIPNEYIQHYSNGVIKMDELKSGPVLVGYIYGGISSKYPNAFFSNDSQATSASSQIFKVYLEIKL